MKTACGKGRRVLAVFAWVLAISVTFGMLTGCSLFSRDNTVLSNQTETLNDKQVHELWKSIRETLETKYGELYRLENYQVEFKNETAADSVIVIDVEVTADRISIVPPGKNQFLLGMEAALEEHPSWDGQTLHNEQLKTLTEEYETPVQTEFSLRIEFSESDGPGSFQLLEGSSAGGSGAAEFDPSPEHNDETRWQAGYDAILSIPE